MAIDSHSEQRTAELIRAVFDSNIYVAAYLSKNARSPNQELFRRWRNGEFVLLVSQAILEEVIEKFDQRGIDQALTVEPARYGAKRMQRTGVRGQRSGVRGQGSGVRGQGAEVRGQRSEGRGQGSGVSSQRSEVGGGAIDWLARGGNNDGIDS